MGGSQPYIGMLLLVPYNFQPLNWVFCDGRLLNIADNDALFALIGTTYGGDGVQTFGVPDLRGRSAIHAGTGGGLATHALGEQGGTENVTLSTLQMPGHTHLFRCTNQGQASSIPTNCVPASGPQVYGPAASGTLDVRTVSSVGGNQQHNNIEPYVALNWIMSLYGVFPPHS